jgi:hypothetical protein
MDTEENRDGFINPQPDRRSYPRYSVDEDSVVLFVGYGAPQQARLVDLSQEGCRLRIEARVTARARLPVEVFFRVKGISFRFRGVLQWTDGHNLGVRFVNMIPRHMVDLATAICEMHETAATRAEAVNRLVAEQEASGPARSDKKERADDRNRQPDSGAVGELLEAARGAAPAVPAELGPQTAKPPARRERRGQARHEVDTVAVIYLVKTGSVLPGRIVDLSLSGCRIHTGEHFPVGIYTRVETEFRLEGLPFRLGGVIQAIHDRNTVGIRFLDLSDRKRQQVMELIGEIEQMRALRMPAEPAAAEDRV